MEHSPEWMGKVWSWEEREMILGSVVLGRDSFPCGKWPDSSLCVPSVAGHGRAHRRTGDPSPPCLQIPVCLSIAAQRRHPPTATTTPRLTIPFQVESLISSILHTLRTYHASRHRFRGGQSCRCPSGSHEIVSQPGARRRTCPPKFLSPFSPARRSEPGHRATAEDPAHTANPPTPKTCPLPRHPPGWQGA